MSHLGAIVERTSTADPLVVDWFTTALRVHLDSTWVRDHVADQHRCTPPRCTPPATSPPAALHAVTDPDLLATLTAGPTAGHGRARESFRGVWYDHRRLPTGEHCLRTAAGHEYPHALLTTDFRSWAFVGERPETTAFEVTRTIRELVREDLLSRGGLMFHGSAAELSDGRGVFLAGPSGAGKTSAAIRLALGGGRPVGTDRTVLLREAGDLLAVGLPMTTRLGAGSVDALGLLGRLADRAPVRAGKFCLSNALVDELLGCPFTPATVVDEIVLLERVPHAPARVTALTGQDATAAVAEHLLTPDPLYRSRWLAADPTPEPAPAAPHTLADLVARRAVSRLSWDPTRHCDERVGQLLGGVRELR